MGMGLLQSTEAATMGKANPVTGMEEGPGSTMLRLLGLWLGIGQHPDMGKKVLAVAAKAQGTVGSLGDPLGPLVECRRRHRRPGMGPSLGLLARVRLLAIPYQFLPKAVLKAVGRPWRPTTVAGYGLLNLIPPQTMSWACQRSFG